MQMADMTCKPQVVKIVILLNWALYSAVFQAVMLRVLVL